MALSNRYPGLCSVCKSKVLAEEGFAEKSPQGWLLKCKPCSGVVQDAKPRIALTQQGGLVAFKPVTFLGGSLFSTYIAAVKGTTYDAPSRSNLAPIGQVGEKVRNLQAAGFLVDVPPSLVATLQAKEAEVEAGVQKAAARADETDRKLQERGLALFPFQRVGCQWLASRTSALLSDDMGLGKTIQALLAIPEGAPVLVIGPAVAKGVWRDEASKWRPDLEVTVLSGRGSFRYPNPGEMIVTNYDVLSEDPGTAPSGCIVIADEAHTLKNAKTARTRRFREAATRARKADGKTWLLTATPLMNRPQELWSVLQAAGLGAVAFGSWEAYCGLYNAQTDSWGAMVWGSPSPEVATRLQKVMLRREKAEVLRDLPAKMYREVTVEVGLAARDRKAMDRLTSLWDKYTRFNRLNDEPRPSDIVSSKVAAERDALESQLGSTLANLDDAEALLKDASGLSFRDMSEVRAALATAKIPALLELVEEYEEQEEPIVVFSAHRAPIDHFAQREGWAVITGDTAPSDRKQIQDDFQAGKLRGVAATIKAGGVALTLTRACNVIFVDLDWSPALNIQAEDRVLRIGQLRPVLITMLVSSFPLDQRVTQLLASKRTLIRQTVQAAARTEVEIELPTLDLSELTREIETEKAREEAAQKAAEERAREFASVTPSTTPEEDRQEFRRQVRQDRWTKEAASEAQARRLPSTPREAWMARSLQTLALLDPDRALIKNDVGFSASDGTVGHKLAFLSSTCGLTEAQWGLAAVLCTKYRRQVGNAEG